MGTLAICDQRLPEIIRLMRSQTEPEESALPDCALLDVLVDEERPMEGIDGVEGIDGPEPEPPKLIGLDPLPPPKMLDPPELPPPDDPSPTGR